MKIKNPSCRPEIVKRFLPLLLSNWSKWEGQFLAQTHNCQCHSFWTQICFVLYLPPLFFNVALHSINSIGEWWFNWQDPSIEGHTNEKPSIRCYKYDKGYISKTSKNQRSVLCRNFWYLMSSCHDSSYQNIFGSKITDCHPTFMTETAERQILPQLWVGQIQVQKIGFQIL